MVKYWGKRDLDLNIPATGSLSMTLSSLATTTKVTFEHHLSDDEFLLNGSKADYTDYLRVSRFFDRVRLLAGSKLHAKVESENNFPPASGLASSASGFAALTVAATKAAGLEMTLHELADLARMGSGSAPRSLLGGFVEMMINPKDTDINGDVQIRSIADINHWDLRLVIALCSTQQKKISSTQGMTRSKNTSPYYPTWLATHEEDMQAARQAILDQDFRMLGEVCEASSFKMHALTISSRPPLVYWQPATMAAMHAIWSLREDGRECYITMDAGPQVKVICRPDNIKVVTRTLQETDGVQRVWVERAGNGVEVL